MVKAISSTLGVSPGGSERSRETFFGGDFMVFSALALGKPRGFGGYTLYRFLATGDSLYLWIDFCWVFPKVLNLVFIIKQTAGSDSVHHSLVGCLRAGAGSSSPRFSQRPR